MEFAWISIGAVISVVAAVTSFAVWSRKDVPGRAFAFAAFLISIPTVWFTVTSVLGHHRPVKFEQVRELGADLRYTLLAHKLVFGEAIYLYLDQPGEPLAMVLPWSTEFAEELQEAARNDAFGNGLEIIIPYEPSLETLPEVHPLPQPKWLPDKPLQEREPQVIERET